MTEYNPVGVLVVEDNPTDAELIKRALQKQRIISRVDLVFDGKEAIDYLKAEGEYVHRKGKPQPACIFLDLTLPGLDGREVLGRIKDDIHTKRIPVVVLTSSEEESDMLRSFQLDVAKYIVKPSGLYGFDEVISEPLLTWILFRELPE